jgi:hypothetical protein
MELNERIEKLQAHRPCSEHCGKLKNLALIAARIWREVDPLAGVMVPNINADTGALIEHASAFYKAAWKQFEDLPGHEDLVHPQETTVQIIVAPHPELPKVDVESPKLRPEW